MNEDTFLKINLRRENNKKKDGDLTQLRWICDCGMKNYIARDFCGKCSQPRPQFS